MEVAELDPDLNKRTYFQEFQVALWILDPSELYASGLKKSLDFQGEFYSRGFCRCSLVLSSIPISIVPTEAYLIQLHPLWSSKHRCILNPKEILEISPKHGGGLFQTSLRKSDPSLKRWNQDWTQRKQNFLTSSEQDVMQMASCFT